RQSKMFLRGDVTQHGAAVPADHSRADCAGDVIVAWGDVGCERAEGVERRFVAPLELFLHVLLNHVHRNVTGAFVHYLHMLFQSALGQLALGVKFSKLSLIIRVSNTTRPQPVADGKANVVSGHDLADFVPMGVEKTFLMMRE